MSATEFDGLKLRAMTSQTQTNDGQMPIHHDTILKLIRALEDAYLCIADIDKNYDTDTGNDRWLKKHVTAIDKARNFVEER